MKLNKLKLSLILPIAAYIVFMATLYYNTSIASLAFFIMVISTITIAILAFNKKEIENVKKA